MRIHYLGPEGTFSHEAALRLRDSLGLSSAELAAQPSIAHVIQAVAQAADADLPDEQPPLGCIPLENSVQGSVTATWDVLGRVARIPSEPDPVREAALQLQILAALRVPVEQYLLTLPGTDLSTLRDVISHPQALGQCDVWLHDHLPQARQTAVSSTAEAARQVAEAVDQTRAAVGPLASAHLFGLTPSRDPIQNFAGNETRFALIGDARRARVQPQGDRWTLSLMLVRVPNEPGGLLRTLTPFYRHGLDLSRIESRPVGHKLGEYLFFIDVHWILPERRAHDASSWRAVREDLGEQGVEVIQLGLFPELNS